MENHGKRPPVPGLIPKPPVYLKGRKNFQPELFSPEKRLIWVTPKIIIGVPDSPINSGEWNKRGTTHIWINFGPEKILTGKYRKWMFERLIPCKLRK